MRPDCLYRDAAYKIDRKEEYLTSGWSKKCLMTEKQTTRIDSMPLSPPFYQKIFVILKLQILIQVKLAAWVIFTTITSRFSRLTANGFSDNHYRAIYNSWTPTTMTAGGKIARVPRSINFLFHKGDTGLNQMKQI